MHDRFFIRWHPSWRLITTEPAHEAVHETRCLFDRRPHRPAMDGTAVRGRGRHPAADQATGIPRPQSRWRGPGAGRWRLGDPMPPSRNIHDRHPQAALAAMLPRQRAEASAGCVGNADLHRLCPLSHPAFHRGSEHYDAVRATPRARAPTVRNPNARLSKEELACGLHAASPTRTVVTMGWAGSGHRYSDLYSRRSTHTCPLTPECRLRSGPKVSSIEQCLSTVRRALAAPSTDLSLPVQGATSVTFPGT